MRFGVAYDQSPVNDVDRSARLPDSDRTWLTIGGRYKYSSALNFDVGAGYIFVKNGSINNSGNPASIPTYGLDQRFLQQPRHHRIRPVQLSVEMSRMMQKWAVAGFAALFAATAFAADVGGVKLADKVAVGGQELGFNGAGIRTRAIFKVYVGSLYLPAKAGDLAGVLAKGPRRIQMNLLRDISSDQLLDALNDGLKDNNSEAELAAVKPQQAQLSTIMKGFGEVKEGSVVTLDFVDDATVIGFNGAAKGTIPGGAFNRALTRIWLGDKPVQADLKKAMLGG